MRRTYLLTALFFLTLAAGYAAGKDDSSIPVFGRRQAVAEERVLQEVVPLGITVGVRINTDGVMVLGTGNFAGVNRQTHSPSEGILLAGDLIMEVNGEPVTNKETLARLVSETEGVLSLLVRRGDTEKTVTLTAEESVKDGKRRIGAWVRDSTKGIGTMTFYDPATQAFGALGHGIVDVDTKLLMSVQNGMVMPSTVTSVKRGTRGSPGELEGTVQTNIMMGSVSANTAEGIYGQLAEGAVANLRTDPLPAAGRAQIQTGAATILTNAVDNTLKEYDIRIENVNRFPSDPTKSMIIRITDPELLEVTGGIIQGMSGSPILQNGRIVGAVTHVFVQDPAKGYGIFIEYMLNGLPLG
jgi:stage IV sporulation protein B